MDKPKRIIPTPQTPRDFEILSFIGQCGGATSQHISTLFFPPSPIPDPETKELRLQPHSNCQLRLQGIYKAGYVERIELPSTSAEGRKHFVYTLTNKGARALAEYQGLSASELSLRKLDKERGRLFLEHLMGVVEIRVAFMYAVSHSPNEASIVTWLDDAQLKRSHAKHKMTLKWPNGNEDRNVVLVPDSYFSVYELRPSPGQYVHTLEYDRGTMTGISSQEQRHTIERKVRMYMAAYKEGGLFTEVYKHNSGRTLFVTSSEKRLQNLKEITEKVGGKARFWFTTLSQIVDITQKAMLDEAERRKAQREGNPMPLRDSPSILTAPIWQKAGADGFFPLLR